MNVPISSISMKVNRIRRREKSSGAEAKSQKATAGGKIGQRA